MVELTLYGVASHTFWTCQSKEKTKTRLQSAEIPARAAWPASHADMAIGEIMNNDAYIPR